MNLSDFIARCKKILNEDAGSEGMVFTLRSASPVKAVETDTVKISDVRKENGETIARVEFTFPRDCGFAANTLKAIYGDIEINSLELVY